MREREREREGGRLQLTTQLDGRLSLRPPSVARRCSTVHTLRSGTVAHPHTDYCSSTHRRPVTSPSATANRSGPVVAVIVAGPARPPSSPAVTGF
jgi:hypothetical protein